MSNDKQQQSSDIQFFNLSFSTVLLLLIAWGLGSVSWKLTLAAVLSASALGLGWFIKSGNLSPRLALVGLGIFFAQLLASLFPFKLSNPFYVFDLHFFGSLLFMVIALPTFVALAFENQFPRLKYWLCGWLPLVFLISTNAYFVIFDFRDVFIADHSRHIGNAVYIYDLLAGEESGKLWKALTYYDFYQPISYLSAAPFFFLFGKSYTVGCLSLILFWLPIAYIYSRKTLIEYWQASQSQASAISFILVGSAMSVSMLKQYMQDFPVLAMVLVYQHLVYRSSFFLRSKGTAWAALAFAIGLLTKSSFILFGAGPWVVAFYRAWKKGKVPILLLNFLSFLGITSFTAGIWYLINRSHYDYTLFSDPLGFPEVTTAESFFWYWPRLLYILSEPLALIAIIGLILLYLQKKRSSYLVANSIFCFLLLFTTATFVQVKDARTIYPIVAYMVPFFLVVLQWGKFNLGKIALVISLVWLIGFNLTLGPNITNPLTDLLSPKSYYIQNAPTVPYSDAPNKSYYIYQKLFHEHFSDSAAPALQIGQDINGFTDRYYKSIYKPEAQVVNRSELGRQKLFYLRDHYWQDHYLFSLSKDTNTLVLKDLGRIAAIGGDLICGVQNLDSAGNVLQTTVWQLKPNQTQWKSKIVPGTTRLTVSFKAHHVWPSGQFVHLTYALFGDASYQPTFVSLEIFEPNTPRIADKILDLSSL